MSIYVPNHNLVWHRTAHIISVISKEGLPSPTPLLKLLNLWSSTGTRVGVLQWGLWTEVWEGAPKPGPRPGYYVWGA